MHSPSFRLLLIPFAYEISACTAGMFSKRALLRNGLLLLVGTAKSANGLLLG